MGRWLRLSVMITAAGGAAVACGGSSDDGIFSDGVSGASGNSSTGGASGATGSGGSATGGSAGSGTGGSGTGGTGAGGSAGGGTGGSAGAGTGGSAGAGTGGSAGAGTGGSAGAGAGGAAGSGGAGGAPTCDAGSRPGGVLLHTTLDSRMAIGSPAAGAGTGAFVTMPNNDFRPALVGDGIRLDQANEEVTFPQRVGSASNIDFVAGAIDFCYLPDYDHADDVNHALFTNTNFSAGGIRIRKAGASNNNAFQVILTDTSGGGFAGQTEIPVGNYRLQTGVWTRVTVSWDFTVGMNERNVRVYFDGAEATPSTTSNGPLTMPAASTTESIVIGRFAGQTWNPLGVLDEFYVYGRAVVP